MTNCRQVVWCQLTTEEAVARLVAADVAGVGGWRRGSLLLRFWVVKTAAVC